MWAIIAGPICDYLTNIFLELDFHFSLGHAEPWRFCFCLPAVAGGRSHVASRRGDPMSRNFSIPEETWVADLAPRHGLQHVWEVQRERKRLVGISGTRMPTNDFQRFPKSCAKSPYRHWEAWAWNFDHLHSGGRLFPQRLV